MEDKKKPIVVFVLGGPGSGKGTQCSHLVSSYGFVHLSAGELLRQERDSGSKNGNLINELMKEGKIVPSEITVELLKTGMEKNGWHDKRFLIDGFPRNQENLDKWEEIMGSLIDFRFVLYLDCSEDTMVQRILERAKDSGRVDDNIESLKKRFHTFVVETKKVVDFYAKQNKVLDVNGEPAPELVFKEIKAAFDKI